MEPTQFSQKQGTLVALLQLGGYVKEVEPIVSHMRGRLNINTDPHNVAHVLWPLSKENLATFNERKVHGGESSLTNIKLTSRGEARARQLLGMDRPKAEAPVPHVRGNGRAAHAVGRDGTDFRRHSSVAVGGPIERRVEKETPLDHVPFVVLSDEEAANYRGSPSTYKTLFGKHHEAQAEEAEAQTEAPSVSAEESVPEGSDTPPEVMAADTHTEYPEPTPEALEDIPEVAVWQFEPDRFPLMAAVLAKKDKVRRYTQAAELLGDDEAELAIQLLEKVKISPLEEEIIRLLG